MKFCGSGEFILSFTDVDKSCPSCECLMEQICLNAILENFRIYSNMVDKSMPTLYIVKHHSGLTLAQNLL